MAQEISGGRTGSIVFDKCFTLWDHPRNIARPGTPATYDSRDTYRGRQPNYPTLGYYCDKTDITFSTSRNGFKWWKIDMQKAYHIEKILFMPPENRYTPSKDLLFRLGNDTNPNNESNPVIHEYIGIVRHRVILVIDDIPDISGRYVIISTLNEFYFSFASIQIITRENFQMQPSTQNP